MRIRPLQEARAWVEQPVNIPDGLFQGLAPTEPPLEIMAKDEVG